MMVGDKTLTVVNSLAGVAHVHHGNPLQAEDSHEGLCSVRVPCPDHAGDSKGALGMTTTIIMQSDIVGHQVSDNDLLGLISAITPRPGKEPYTKMELRNMADEMIRQWSAFRAHLGHD